MQLFSADAGSRLISQQTTSRMLAANNGRRTAQIQIDPRHGILLQKPNRTEQVRNVPPNHLGHYRTRSGLLRDGMENVPPGLRMAVDPEILRHPDIGTSATVNHAPEGKIRHLLHRGKIQAGHASLCSRIHHPREAGRSPHRRHGGAISAAPPWENLLDRISQPQGGILKLTPGGDRADRSDGMTFARTRIRTAFFKRIR